MLFASVILTSTILELDETEVHSTWLYLNSLPWPEEAMVEAGDFDLDNLPSLILMKPWCEVMFLN
jgi:hypothetical protein